MEKENWKPIPNFEGLYEASTKGQIRNSKGQLIAPQKSAKGYLRLRLNKEGKGYNFKVHRLIALTFIPNPENKPQVNHINEIKTDNRVINLEWVNALENNRHGTGRDRNIYHKKRAVFMCDKNTGEKLKRFDSMHQASKAVGVSMVCIEAVCKKRQKTSAGYKWKFAPLCPSK